MRTSRLFEVALAAILALLAICLACGIAGWFLWGGGGGEATPIATHTPTAEATLPFTPSPTFTPPPALPGLTPTPLVVADPSLTDRASLEQQFWAAQPGQRLVLRLHDDHLTRQAAAYLAAQPETTYRNVTVRFTPGLVELDGQVNVLGLWAPATVRGQVTVGDCRPAAEITSLAVGGLLTPRWARDYVADLIYDALDRYPDDLPICLESVEVRQGEAIVTGIKR
jgi:hypothetical protein